MNSETQESDIEMMKLAIAQADACVPIPKGIPKVGAIIAVEGVVIGKGKRGNGTHNDNEHAEHNAFQSVADRTQLPRATVYTTLEPCTRDVRSKPDECCTEQIIQGEVKKVFIGILDPNQGVRGKGLWELQRRGIHVELFPPELAKTILAMNEKFIRFQMTLGAEIISPQPGLEINLTKGKDGGWFGKCDLVCQCSNDPDPTYKVIVQRGGEWWPAPGELHKTGEHEWKAQLYFGGDGEHTIHIVRATGAGTVLLAYYQDVVNSNKDRMKQLEDRFEGKDLGPEGLTKLPGSFQGIRMGSLPKGLESQTSVQVNVVKRTN